MSSGFCWASVSISHVNFGVYSKSSCAQDFVSSVVPFFFNQLVLRSVSGYRACRDMRLTQRALDWWDSARFQALGVASSCFR
jgi:hypothetical protein